MFYIGFGGNKLLLFRLEIHLKMTTSESKVDVDVEFDIEFRPISVLDDDLPADIICNNSSKYLILRHEGLSADILRKYPEMNIEDICKKREIGDVYVNDIRDKKEGRRLSSIAFLVLSNESTEHCLESFQNCLDTLAKNPLLKGKTIAFPYGFGCRGNSNWPSFLDKIKQFAKKVQQDHGCAVFIATRTVEQNMADLIRKALQKKHIQYKLMESERLLQGLMKDPERFYKSLNLVCLSSSTFGIELIIDSAKKFKSIQNSFFPPSKNILNQLDVKDQLLNQLVYLVVLQSAYEGICKDIKDVLANSYWHTLSTSLCNMFISNEYIYMSRDIQEHIDSIEHKLIQHKSIVESHIEQFF